MFGIDDELNGSRRLVIHRLGQGNGLFPHRLAGLFIEERRRRLFDNLLVAALDRAFPFAQVNDIAVAVGHDLDFDMAGFFDELFDENPVIAETGFGFVDGRGKSFAGLFVIIGDAHALAAAAGGRLQHHRIADLAGDGDRLLGVLEGYGMTGDGVDACFFGQFFRFDLITHGNHGTGRRTDQGDLVAGQLAGKGGVLGQESISRVNGSRLGLFGGIDDGIHHQIALSGRRRSDANGLVGHFHMQGILIGFGIDGNRLDFHFARRLDHPAGDFTTVGDENFFEHCLTQIFLIFTASSPPETG